MIFLLENALGIFKVNEQEFQIPWKSFPWKMTLKILQEITFAHYAHYSVQILKECVTIYPVKWEEC